MNIIAVYDWREKTPVDMRIFNLNSTLKQVLESNRGNQFDPVLLIVTPEIPERTTENKQ